MPVMKFVTPKKENGDVGVITCSLNQIVGWYFSEKSLTMFTTFGAFSLDVTEAMNNEGYAEWMRRFDRADR